jgi:hypothetical protein
MALKFERNPRSRTGELEPYLGKHEIDRRNPEENPLKSHYLSNDSCYQTFRHRQLAKDQGHPVKARFSEASFLTRICRP